MKTSDFSKEILLGSSLDSKLFNCDDLIFDECAGREIPLTPSRSEKIKFSPDQLKFPKKNTLKNDSSKALALHFFANHELLAIEMMAAALYCYPTLTEEDKYLSVVLFQL